MEEQKTDNKTQTILSNVSTKKTSILFSFLIFLTFFWILTGISFIYGVRMWHDTPIHPSFIPIIAAAFSAALSFTLVLALEYATGPIKINTANIKFEGASGPIILWCICFLIIVFGLYLLGLPEVIDLKSDHTPTSLYDLFRFLEQNEECKQIVKELD